MSQSNFLFVLLLATFIIYGKASYCTCEDQVTQASCTSKSCVWASGQCSTFQEDCSTYNSSDPVTYPCSQPLCWLNTTNSTNPECVKTPTCDNIQNVAPSVCLKQGCQAVVQSADLTNCTSFQGCQAIKVEPLCSGTVDVTSNGDAKCVWNPNGNTCQSVSQCSDYPLALCPTGNTGACEVNPTQTACQNIDCSRRSPNNASNCTDGVGASYCQLTSTSNSSVFTCGPKQCSQFNSVDNCTQNNAVCYWTGKSCDTCYNSGYLISSIILAVLLVIIF